MFPLITKHFRPKPLSSSDWQQLIAAARLEFESVQALLGIPHFFILTDSSGTVVDCIGSEIPVDSPNGSLVLKPGVSLNKRHAGMNAVSQSMDTGYIEIVQGEDHSSPPFKHLNCICSPLFYNNRIVAYVDFSFEQSQEVQLELAKPLIFKMAENIIRHGLPQGMSNTETISHELLHEHGLSPREKEVAVLWYTNKSALFISQQLGITEGTVRNVVKRIYTKMDVRDRGALIHKMHAG